MSVTLVLFDFDNPGYSPTWAFDCIDTAKESLLITWKYVSFIDDSVEWPRIRVLVGQEPDSGFYGYIISDEVMSKPGKLVTKDGHIPHFINYETVDGKDWCGEQVW